MQNLIIAQPYDFVPPRFSWLWHAALSPLLPGMLRKSYGVESVEFHGREKLQASLTAGHGILLVPNHCRPSDPFALVALGNACRRPVHIMSSWHIFMEGRLQRFLLQRIGVFSVHRESVDRKSLRCAENILSAARHPLVMFPEAIVSRTNDHLMTFLRGPALVARRAAVRRAATGGGRVVMHPVFIRYFFGGDVDKAAHPVLDDIEKRLGSLPQASLPLRERIRNTGHALLASKEVEYLGAPRSGPLMERVAQLREEVLAPLERKWIRSVRRRETMARVKAIRMAIFPGLIDEQLVQAEKEQLWREIADLYFVQQLHCYPERYLDGDVPERLLEMVEHYEEDLTDKVRAHRPLRAAVCIGDALEVEPSRARHPHGDPLMDELRRRLEAMKDSSLTMRKSSQQGIEP